MKSIKLRNEKGKIKYVQRTNSFPIKVGDFICFKWNRRWEVIKIWRIKK